MNMRTQRCLTKVQKKRNALINALPSNMELGDHVMATTHCEKDSKPLTNFGGPGRVAETESIFALTVEGIFGLIRTIKLA